MLSCCLWSREIPHLHLWMVIHDRIRPQATRIHLQEEPSRHTCMATMHDVYAYRDMISQSVTAQVKKWSSQTCSLCFSPHPGPDLPLDVAIHHACITPDCKEAFQQAFVNDPEMRALANLIITGWPKDIKESPLSPLSILATQRNPHH